MVVMMLGLAQGAGHISHGQKGCSACDTAAGPGCSSDAHTAGQTPVALAAIHQACRGTVQPVDCGA